MKLSIVIPAYNEEAVLAAIVACMVGVRIHNRPQTYELGRKITWQHGVIMLWTII